MKHFFWFLSFFMVFVSCEKYDFDRVAFTKVITVGAIEVSATSAFLTGDIEGLRAGRVVESGFVYSDRASRDEMLRRGAPNVISQPSPFRDTITVDRAFAARITDLQQGTPYFFRAYIELEDEPDLAYGQIDSFFTPVLDLPSPTILRQESGCPTTVTVSFQLDGYSPGPGRSTGFVWSNNEEENYPTLQDGVVRQLESSSSNFSGDLEVDCDQTYFVRVFIQNTATEIFYSEVLAFSTRSGGSWIEQPSFPGASVGRNGPIAFAGDQDQAIYLGAGGEDGRNFSDFYQYTNASKSWQFIDRFDSLEVSHSTSASLGSIGFALGGRPSHNICTECPDEHQQPMVNCICSIDRLMMYDPSGSSWSTLGILPGSGRRMHGAALTIGERLYFGTGIDFHACIDADLGHCWFTEFAACALSSNCLSEQTALKFHNLFSDFHYFDESGLTWVVQDDVPGLGRISAVSMVIDQEGYLGLGRHVEDPKSKIRSFFSEYTTLYDFYQFEPTQPPGDQWTRQDDFPQAYDEAIGFGIGSKGYVIASTETELKTFWQFDPSASSGQQWKALPNFPSAVEGTPQAAVVIGTKAFVYFNSSSDDFWMYVPELE